jgi:AcrR family transcriptional regulator
VTPVETLRERKKRRTRDALLHAALDLFTTQGYEQTTVDEIADAVEVSQRTFFRYFAGKQEAALAVQEMTEAHLVEAVRARPPQETPLEALRQAVLAGWDALHEAIDSVVPVETYLRMFRVIESTPVLLAAYLRRSVDTEEALARVLAEREGVDVDTDVRPRVVVAVFCAVLQLSGRTWSRGDDVSVEAMRDLTRSYLDQVGPELIASWRHD